MKQINDSTAVIVTSPVAIKDNASWTTNTIDTLGFTQLDIYIIVGATDVDMATLKLQQSDDSGMSGAADVTNGNFATGTDSAGNATEVPQDDDDNTLWHISVDLKGKKRYMDLVATGGDGSTGAYMAAMAILSQPSTTPSTKAGRGFEGELFC